MAINNITQTISTIPEAAHRGVDVQTQFVIKQEDFQDHLQGTTVIELNTLKDQLNTRIGEINSTVTTMNGYATSASSSASTATTKAGEASTSASSASTSASEALTSRNQAETFKNSASTSASTATTKASEASASASSVSTSASTATTKASEASASALSASTSASTATTKASEASTSRNQAETFAQQASASALSASTSASTATTKASEASTSRNQAETFAQQASASALSVDVNNIAHRTGNETIAGVKTFSSSPIVPTPTTSTEAANKAYVDTKQANLGFTPVQQGNGIGQTPSSVVKIGWSNEYRTKITIDATDMGNIVMDSNIGVANSSLVKTALNASGNAPIYACRAWVNFNGTGTVAIRASGNISSITDNGVGNYVVNFTTAMPDANYAVPSTILSQGFGNGSIGETIRTTTAVNVRGYENGSTTPTDCLFVEIAVFR